MTTPRGPWAVLFALCVGQSVGLPLPLAEVGTTIVKLLDWRQS